MRIETQGIAFTSYDVKAKKLTKEEMTNEKISFDKNLKKTNNLEDISYHTTTKTDSSKLTIFKDPTNDKYVIVSLSEETIEKLKTHFNDDDFMQKEDATVRLTGDAEAFVSGWFADIAYKREFLEADENNDGNISKDEYFNVKNSYDSVVNAVIKVNNKGGEKLAYYSEKVTEQYIKYKESSSVYRDSNVNNLVVSLDEELNRTLTLDKNFDGMTTPEELALSRGKDLESGVIAIMAEFGVNLTPLEDKDMGLFDLLIIDTFHKFTQLDEKERVDYLSEILEKTLSNRKEETQELKESELEKSIENILKQKKLIEDKNKGIDISI